MLARAMGFFALGVACCKHVGSEAATPLPGQVTDADAGHQASAGVDFTAHPTDAGALFPGADPAPWRRDQGCAATLRPSGDAVADARRLGELCAEGMTPLLTAPLTVPATSGVTFELPFRIAGPTACLRAAVVAPDSPGGIDVAIVSDRDQVLAATASTEAVAVTPEGGPVCVREPSDYRLRFRLAARDRGADAAVRAESVVVQLWKTER